MHETTNTRASSRYALTWVAYGLIVSGSGCYRYLARPNGEKGLYFGLVMGALALAAGASIARGAARAGHALGCFAVALVAGWFAYESLVREGGSGEARLLIVLALSLIQAGIALAHLRRDAPR